MANIHKQLNHMFRVIDKDERLSNMKEISWYLNFYDSFSFCHTIWLIDFQD